MAAARDMGWTVFQSAMGPCAVVFGDRGIVRLVLPERSTEAAKKRVRELHPEASEAKPPPAVRRVIQAVTRKLAGKPVDAIDAELDLRSCSPFAREVYTALCDVPPGQTVTYGDLAARVGSGGGARAVGRAMATNPLPILVPCHRVLGANGQPGGFSAYGGLATKSDLLALEGVRLDALPYDPAEAVPALRKQDRELGKLIERVGPFRLQLAGAKSTFESLARAIVYQQLNGTAAATILGRVRALFPKNKLRADVLLTLDDAALRGAGLSGSKTAALRDLADKTVNREVPTLARLRKMDDDAIVEALTRVRGIGPWSVHMLLMFQLGRPDVLPVGDYGVRKGFAVAFGHDDAVSPAVLSERAERWRPYRSVASWYLWRALEL